jgi:hypothetical protein
MDRTCVLIMGWVEGFELVDWECGRRVGLAAGVRGGWLLRAWARRLSNRR